MDDHEGRAALLLERFYRYTVPPPPSTCVLWLGGVDGFGYGRFRAGDKVYGAHQFIHAATHGPQPAGLHVLHSCDTPLCVNVSHLSLGTRRDNMHGAAVRGRLFHQRKTHCKHGHPFDEKNTYRPPSGRRCCRKCIARWASAWSEKTRTKGKR